MGLSTAERNKRKRERKKKAKEAVKKQEEAFVVEDQEEKSQVEIEYVAEDLVHFDDANDSLLLEQLKRFQAKSSVVTLLNGDRQISAGGGGGDGIGVEQERDDIQENYDHEASQQVVLSKRKLREELRPTVAELKRRVLRPDLVEAHDITAADPDFLIQLKATPGTVPVPRHWGRKRKYLQGKVSSDLASTVLSFQSKDTHYIDFDLILCACDFCS